MKILELAESAFAEDLQREKTMENIKIYMDGNIVDQAEIFEYSGINMHIKTEQKVKNEAEINKRVESAVKLYYTMLL